MTLLLLSVPATSSASTAAAPPRCTSAHEDTSCLQSNSAITSRMLESMIGCRIALRKISQPPSSHGRADPSAPVKARVPNEVSNARSSFSPSGVPSNAVLM